MRKQECEEEGGTDTVRGHGENRQIVSRSRALIGCAMGYGLSWARLEIRTRTCVLLGCLGVSPYVVLGTCTCCSTQVPVPGTVVVTVLVTRKLVQAFPAADGPESRFHIPSSYCTLFTDSGTTTKQKLQIHPQIHAP